MFTIIGIAIVFAGVVGGYLMEHGNLVVLLQPAEVVIIFGAAIGALVIAYPPSMLKAIMGGFKYVVSGKMRSKSDYMDMLKLLSEIFQKIRKDGVASIESDIEKPQNSAIFKKYPTVMANHHARDFITDTFRIITTTKISHSKLSLILDAELEAQHEEMMVASSGMAFVAESLPGLGIVAAVLGVVITMGLMAEPPEVLGHSIGAALVGTFLGILGSYGFVGPAGKRLEKFALDELQYMRVIKETIVAFVGGEPPQIAIEFGRRVVPVEIKPSFAELDAALRKMKG